MAYFKQRIISKKGRSLFLSIDSRITGHNLLFEALKTKSFTDADITLFFIIFDILSDPTVSITVQDLCGQIDEFLSRFPDCKTYDESTIRFRGVNKTKTDRTEKLRTLESSQFFFHDKLSDLTYNRVVNKRASVEIKKDGTKNVQQILKGTFCYSVLVAKHVGLNVSTNVGIKSIIKEVLLESVDKGHCESGEKGHFKSN